MRKFVLGVILGGALVAASAAGALAARMEMVTLHPATMHNMEIAHATGSADISYTKHDATIKLTTEKLPNPMALHEHAYVLWLVNGNHKISAGSFMVHNGMGALHTMTMDTNFNKLVVTAERSAHAMHPMGVTVLIGQVMHH